ncbi:MAG: hypothetical protein IPN94_14985 [Sphingobacteriales bacterium]|nr:hypothetical protein [Sphingobacteriales bacterium]
MVTKANITKPYASPVGMQGNTVDVNLYDQIAAATLGYCTYVLLRRRYRCPCR